MIKYLLWDGIYETREGNCNKPAPPPDPVDSAVPKHKPVSKPKNAGPQMKSLVHDPPLAGEGQRLDRTQLRKALIGLMGSINGNPLEVTILAVSEDFIPVRQNMEMKIKLSPIERFQELLLRIYDKKDCLVYQEIFDKSQIQALPDKIPSHEVPERIYAKCANLEDGPYRAALWASTAEIPNKKEIEKKIQNNITALDQGTHEQIAQDLNQKKINASLKGAIDPDGGNPQSVICDIVGERWYVNGDPYDYVITRRQEVFKIDLIFETKEKPGELVHDQFSAGKQKSGLASKVGDNLSKVRLPKIRHAAYQVPTFGVTGKGTAYYLKEGLVKWKTKSLTPLEDARAKVEHLADNVFKKADQEVKAEEGVLRIFMAPEFYFTHPDRPYKQSELYTILEALQELSAQNREWLFAPGTIWWSGEWIEEKDRTFDVEIPYSGEVTKDNILDALFEGANKKNELGLLLPGPYDECGISAIAGGWKIHHRRLVQDIEAKIPDPKKRRLRVTGTVRYKPASKKTGPNYTNVVYNTESVLYNGRILCTHQKMYPSDIDGLKGYSRTPADVSARDVVAAAIRNRQPLDKTKETWGRWVAEIEKALISTDGRSVFYVNGLLCGIEVCLDHSNTRLKTEYEADHPGGTGLDIQLLVAAGMPKDNAAIKLREKGLFLRCDGGFPRSKYASAFQQGVGNLLTELANREILLSNPVSNEIQVLMDPTRKVMQQMKDDWAMWNALSPADKLNKLVYNRTAYLRSSMASDIANSIEESLVVGRDLTTHGVTDPKDSLAVYDALLDINV